METLDSLAQPGQPGGGEVAAQRPGTPQDDAAALRDGADPESITNRSGEPLGQLFPFGDGVFTPLPPCRVIDTRVAAGKFAPGETRGYTLRGETTDYSAYGGVARDGCGIPDRVSCGPHFCFVNGAQALVLNVTAIEPESPGFLTLWAGNHAEPQGPRLAYATQPPNSDLACATT